MGAGGLICNDRNAYILGAGYSHDAGLPLVSEFTNRMRDAFESFERQGKRAERDAIGTCAGAQHGGCWLARRIPIQSAAQPRAQMIQIGAVDRAAKSRQLPDRRSGQAYRTRFTPMSTGKALRQDSMRSSLFGFLLLSCYEKSSFPRTDRHQAGQRRSVDKVEEL